MRESQLVFLTYCKTIALKEEHGNVTELPCVVIKLITDYCNYSLNKTNCIPFNWKWFLHVTFTEYNN